MAEVLQGKDLMIAVNGITLAASKSCTVDVDCDTIKVSSPDDGQWEHSIAGRKSWKVSTNHLVKNPTPQYPVLEAVAPAWGTNNYKYTITYNGQSRTLVPNQVGLGVIGVSVNTDTLLSVNSYGFFDPRESSEIDSFIAALDDVEENFTVIIGVDVVFITSAVRTAISTHLSIPEERIPIGEFWQSGMAAIGNTAENTVGIISVCDQAMQWAHCKGPVEEGTFMNGLRTRIKDFLLKTGTVVKLAMYIDNAGNDYLSGSAIVKQAKVTATKGNLMTGSFQFEGTGPLS